MRNEKRNADVPAIMHDEMSLRITRYVGRTALGCCARLLPALLAAVVLFSAAHTFAAQVVLQDRRMLVCFNSRTGALTRLEYKTAHWHI